MLQFVRALAVACASLALIPLASRKAAYPNKPIHFIVAFVPAARPTPSPGRSPTICRRRSASRSSSRTSPAPAATSPGTTSLSSDPDGYTLLLAENAVAISQALYKKSKSNFDRSRNTTRWPGLRHRHRRWSSPTTCRSSPWPSSSPIRRPCRRKMNFASAGVGSVSHLNFEVFMDKTGMQAVHVPYKGGGQAIGDVIAVTCR